MTVRANTERSEEARSAHVPPGVSSHARADEWDSYLERRCLESPEFAACLEYELQASFQQDYPDPFHDAVSAELVACTLGQRSRPELRVDIPGRILQAVNRMRDVFRRAGFSPS